MQESPPTTQGRPLRVFRDGVWSEGEREVIGETAIAIVVNGGAEAVMMATCADLEDFGLGFALTEGLVERADQIREIEVANTDLGVEIRLWLEDEASARHTTRRRRRAGPVGCGLCGVESLEEAMRPTPQVRGALALRATELIEAMKLLAARQPINANTRAAHAAAFYTPEQSVVAVREDIGRHNALDKLVGALVRANQSGDAGAVLVTSRVSIELVQKAAFLGSPVLAAISAPSSLAVEIADEAGITLCGIVRDNGLEVFTHAQRIL
jgi:FdhD protein